MTRVPALSAAPGGAKATESAGTEDRRVHVPFLGFIGRRRTADGGVADGVVSDGGAADGGQAAGRRGVERDAWADGGRWPEVPGRADVLALASLALRYPDEWLTARASDLRDLTAALPDSEPARELRDFTAWFAAEEPDQLRRAYVETFDMRRKTSLHLTYFHHGDTRRRGMALAALKAQLRAAGHEVADGELPDYLPALLEFAAVEGPARGESPLRMHRAGIELIHQALAQAESPYAAVLAAVRAVIGELSPSGRAQVADLLAAGPPTEDVGLAPFGADHPALPPAPDATFEGAQS